MAARMAVTELFGEALRFRQLVSALAARHLAARYRGSVLGFFWSILNPLLLMSVYTLVFSFYIRFSTEQHYSIFLFCGLLPWIWSSSALTEGSASITGGGHLITKSMFPAQLLAIVAVITTGVNFLLSLPLLIIFMIIAGVPLTPALAALPLLLLLQFVFLTGAVLVLASLNVFYRDVQHLTANVLNFLFFLSPIIYPADVVPQKFRFTLELNPLAQFTIAYHQIFLEGTVPSAQAFGYLGLWAAIALMAGSMVYSKFRESFAELV